MVVAVSILMVGRLIVDVVMVGVIIWQSRDQQASDQIENENPVRDGISVHDLNWDDARGMNEHVSRMTLNLPPYFMDRRVETHLDLTDFFQWLSENQDLLRDQPEVPGYTLSSDFEVVLRFTNLTGDESFLNWNGSERTLDIIFYVDRSLGQMALDIVGEAAYAYFREQNPVERITLVEVDWNALHQNYETYIYGVTIDAPQAGPVFFPIDILDPTDVLRFFENNRYNVSQDRNDLYNYLGAINFRWESEDGPEIICGFFMTETMHQELVSLIADEIWEEARNRVEPVEWDEYEEE